MAVSLRVNLRHHRLVSDLLQGPAWDVSLQAFFVFWLLYVPFRAVVVVFAQPTIAAGEALLQARRNNVHRHRPVSTSMRRRGAVNADSAANSAANSAVNSARSSPRSQSRMSSRNSLNSTTSPRRAEGPLRASQRVYVSDDADADADADGDGDVAVRAARRGHEPEALTELRATLHKALHRPQKGSDRAVEGSDAPSASSKDVWGPQLAPQKLSVMAGGGGGGGGGGSSSRSGRRSLSSEGLGL